MIPYQIALVEDDDETAFYTKEFLLDCGFKVDCFTLATDAIIGLKLKKYDILLLDLNLPDFNGFEVLKSIKNIIAIPIIVISAYSDTKIKLQAFKLGVSDYIVKPYDLQELEARIWATFCKGNIEQENKSIFQINENNIMFEDKKLDLTQIESQILRTLIINKNNTTSREKLALSLSKISSQRSLDYHIKNIRKKINDESSNPKYLKTEYGTGYILSF